MGQPLSQSLATGQVATSTVAAEAVPFRSGRQSVTILNLDSTITVYVGASSAVTSSNGVPLEAKRSIKFDTAAAVWAVAASGTPTLAFAETYQ